MTTSWLTNFQVEVSQLFFSLPESSGFAVAGGAALIIRGLVQRPTRDIDLFLLEVNSPSLPEAAASFETALSKHGWTHKRLIDQKEFVRLIVSNSLESLVVDLGRDSPAGEPPDNTDLGPTLGAQDLATRKTLALSGRAEGRDFSDVYELAHRYGKDALLQWAAAADIGFDRLIFAEMLASLDRLTDDDLPVDAAQASPLRAFYREWVNELTAKDG